MNIFVLDHRPEVCATYHCDAHVRKMLVEYAQILCTANHLLGVDAPYKPTHQYRACVKWAAESQANWTWLWSLGLAIGDEYGHRFGNYTHKSFLVIKSLQVPPLKVFPSTRLTGFAQDIPKKYRCFPKDTWWDIEVQIKDIVIAYRAYYIGEKQHLAKWTGRPVPWWFEEKDDENCNR